MLPLGRAHAGTFTGAEALAHNLEAYFAAGFHPLCDAIALEGMGRAMRALPAAVHDGLDVEAIIRALEAAKTHTGGPSVVVCETIKGKGVSFMENNPDFHGKAPSPEQLEQALKELAD